MKAIVAVDKNWGIGFNGELLEHIPEDMKFFKNMTLNKVVVMGRKTFDSLPNGEPLKDRINVVISKTLYDRKDIVLFEDTKKALEYLIDDSHEDVFIIGGESIYKEFLMYCDEVYVTKIDKEYMADRFFPDLDNSEGWELVRSSDVHSYNGINYQFCLYKYNGRKDL